MNRIVNKLIALALVIVFAACEEVIEVDLNSADPVVNAEGLIEKDSLAWIKLSYSSDYFDSEESVKIEDALVTIEDEEGNYENLIHVGDGLYKGNSIYGDVDQKYTITIVNDDVTHTASAELFTPLEVYSIDFEKNELMRPGDEELSYKAILKLSSSPLRNDYCLIKFWVNGVEDEMQYYLVNKEFYNINDTIEYSPFQLKLNIDDELKTVVYSIDEATFKYYQELNELLGGRMGAASTPYNPHSNFGSDVMGYFAAWSLVEHNTTVSL